MTDGEIIKHMADAIRLGMAALAESGDNFPSLSAKRDAAIRRADAKTKMRLALSLALAHGGVS